MSSTIVSAPSATPSSGCGAQLYDTPVQDAVCAMPAGGNHTDIMAACCGAADVVSYYDGCGLYCLAAGQSVADLTSCLFDHGAAYTDVFCRGNTTATATGTGTALPTSAGASIVVTHSDGASHTQSGDSSSSDSSSNPSDSPGAAASVRPEFGSLSTLGLTIGALLFSATAFGAFQL
ncbi:hypothetical protein F4677DRAFT_101614 [Hypoxylon crocopeplum]|nr:hypothetical protein F4677DRAFT_101614 [Hypoxylon crocopeplum]